MGIPNKAFREKSLTREEPIDNVSNKTWHVRFIDNGELKSGIFRKLAPEDHFPELFAKMSVATSVFKQSLQGGQITTEHLVFDEHDNISGILYLPPQDSNLLKKAHNDKHEIETLLLHWFLGGSTLYQDSLELHEDIGHTMFWYWFMVHMKSVNGITPPKSLMNLTALDYELFPCVQDSKPYKKCTGANFEQESLIPFVPPSVQKNFLSLILSNFLPEAEVISKQFIRLAADPIAHKQKVGAALKILLTYQPGVLRARLARQVGDLTLNYSSLSTKLQMTYEKEFPFLCNEKTDKDTFVNFMMTLYHQQYVNLYKVVVFYMGCDDNTFEIPLAATHNELYKSPSLFQNIVAWAQHENATTYADSPDEQYNMIEIKKHYHQIWRDAYAPKFKILCDASTELITELCKLICPKAKIVRKFQEEDNHYLDLSLQLFGSLEGISIQGEEPADNKALFKSLMLMIDFSNQFQQILKTYYQRKCSDLLDKDNYHFMMQLEQLCSEYEYEIMASLIGADSQMNEFVRIIRELKLYSQQIHFKVHLLNSDLITPESNLSQSLEARPIRLINQKNVGTIDISRKVLHKTSIFVVQGCIVKTPMPTTHDLSVALSTHE